MIFGRILKIKDFIMLILCFDENDFDKLCMRYLCSDFHFEDLFRKLKNNLSDLKPEFPTRFVSIQRFCYICGQLVGCFYSRFCET